MCGPPSQGPPPRWLHTDCQRMTCTSPTFPPKSELHKLALSEHRCCINDGWDGVCGSVARIFRRALIAALHNALQRASVTSFKRLKHSSALSHRNKSVFMERRLCKVIICGKAWNLHFWSVTIGNSAKVVTRHLISSCLLSLQFIAWQLC